MKILLATLMILIIAIAAWASSDEMDTGAMLVGKQMLEVTDNRQMTLRTDCKVTSASISPDGRNVIYLTDKQGVGECRLAKISTGKTITVMDASPIIDTPPAGVEWTAVGLPAWSPDSSLFALVAIHFPREGDAETMEQYVVIYSAAGAQRKMLPISKETGGLDGLQFSPDSKKLLLYLSTRDIERSDNTHQLIKWQIQSVNIGTGASRIIFTSNFFIHPIGWSEDGSLLCRVSERDGPIKKHEQLHKIALDGSSDEVIVPDLGWLRSSPDGVLAANRGDPLTVKNLATDKQTEISKNADFIAWAPNSRMLFYERNESITDTSTAVRTRNFQSLWLSSILPGKLDRMCIALDAEDAPSCSRDCHKIAYISQSQLYIAELALREPTIDEKLTAGIPLTEEEMKQKLLENGKQIGQAVLMYSDDYEGKLPPTESITEAIHDNLRHADVFFRPGTKDNIFKYIDPGVEKLSDITNPSDTIIGELDAGYGWNVVVYADTHTEVKQK